MISESSNRAIGPFTLESRDGAHACVIGPFAGYVEALDTIAVLIPEEKRRAGWKLRNVT